MEVMTASTCNQILPQCCREIGAPMMKQVARTKTRILKEYDDRGVEAPKKWLGKDLQLNALVFSAFRKCSVERPDIWSIVRQDVLLGTLRKYVPGIGDSICHDA